MTSEYLAYNLKDPALAQAQVRKALGLAIDRESYVKYKLLGFGSVSVGLLPPLLPESKPTKFNYDPAQAEALLDQAGYKRRPDGIRLRLSYICSPVREGIEKAKALKEMLKKIGVELNVRVVELAVYFDLIRKGSFQLFSSRWVGVSDGSLLQAAYASDSKKNRLRYQNKAVDRLIALAQREPDEKKRIELLAQVQDITAEELPYFPLWYWNNALIVRKTLTGLTAQDLSLSGGYRPVAKLRRAGK